MKQEIEKCNHRFVLTKTWVDENSVLWGQICCADCGKKLTKPKKGTDNVIHLDLNKLVSETKDT